MDLKDIIGFVSRIMIDNFGRRTVHMNTYNVRGDYVTVSVSAFDKADKILRSFTFNSRATDADVTKLFNRMVKYLRYNDYILNDASNTRNDDK